MSDEYEVLLMPKALYDEMCETIREFERCPEDDMSDGEWLDVFYDLVTKIKEELKP